MLKLHRGIQARGNQEPGKRRGNHRGHPWRCEPLKATGGHFSFHLFPLHSILLELVPNYSAGQMNGTLPRVEVMNVDTLRVVTSGTQNPFSAAGNVNIRDTCISLVWQASCP